MNSDSSPLRFEKMLGSGLFLAIVALGWGPFLVAAWRTPYLEHAFLPVLLAIGILSLSLIYDAAEHFIARGRGIYFAAIFCSLPATGILISDPGMLPAAMLVLLVSAAIWFAARATGENRRFFLAMLAGLLLISGFAFYTFSGALALLLPVWIATAASTHRTRNSAILILAYAAGMALRLIGGQFLPLFHVSFEGLGVMTTALMSPWRMYLLPIIITLLIAREPFQPWHVVTLLTLVAASLLSILTKTGLQAVGAVLSPLLTLLAGDLALESFVPDLRKSRRWLLALPLLAAAVVLTIVGAFALDGRYAVPALGWLSTALALALAIALILAALLDLPRWGFALMVAAGIWFGSLFWPHSEFLPGEIESTSSPWIWVVVAGIVAVAAGISYRIYYGRPIPRHLLNDRSVRFGDAEFRRFSDASSWVGAPAVVVDSENYHFIIFGDVTGAESPVTARSGGYFAFRALTQVIRSVQPLFAVSLGDLAAHAGAYPIRRVRQLLRHVPVPMTAIPGNHDVVARNTYDPQYFHALFRADNHTFRLGPVQFVLLNNAWGSLKAEQFVWLAGLLKDNLAPFVLVFCHKPVFDLRPGMSYAMEDRPHAELLHELFRAHDVTAVFSGHIHSLLSEMRDGVTYVISGGAGSKLTSAEDEYHYLTVHVSRDRLIVHARSLGDDTSPLLELHFSPRSCSSAAAASRI
jgi:hypothetical protein